MSELKQLKDQLAAISQRIEELENKVTNVSKLKPMPYDFEEKA